MNPAISGKLATRVPLVPPLDSLQDKTIYMINLSWEGPDAANYFYGAMTEWLDKHYSGVKTVVKVTAEGMFGSDPSILKEITASKADAAIVGVAG
jgi:predicted metal-dependent phosphotriesterase family hydrolase